MHGPQFERALYADQRRRLQAVREGLEELALRIDADWGPTLPGMH